VMNDSSKLSCSSITQIRYLRGYNNAAAPFTPLDKLSLQYAIT
jgi:hypothetical protein